MDAGTKNSNVIYGFSQWGFSYEHWSFIIVDACHELPTRVVGRGKKERKKQNNQNHRDNAIKDMSTFPNSFLQSVYETAQQWQKLKDGQRKFIHKAKVDEGEILPGRHHQSTSPFR